MAKKLLIIITIITIVPAAVYAATDGIADKRGRTKEKSAVTHPSAYPWTSTFLDNGLNDSIATTLLSVSGGKPFYQDNARAGIWALTPPVAIRYGLTIDRYIDERYDPLLSAQAAAHYMADLIQFYNDTTKAIEAYILSPAVASDSANRGQTHIPHTFTYKLTPTLDSICSHTSGIKIKIPSPVRLSTMSARCNNFRTFRLLNPTIAASSGWIMAGTDVYIGDTIALAASYPIEQAEYDSAYSKLQTALDSHRTRLASEIKKANAEIIYRVKSGDTLGHIARRHGVTVRQIKAWNGLKSDMIRIGQRLKIRK